MKVAICVSEAVPFAKTGGLADVAGALPKALKDRKIDSIVIMPAYKSVMDKNFNLELVESGLSVKLNETSTLGFDLYRTRHEGIDFYFIRNDNFFGRENLYGTPQGDYPDNNIRFGFFSKAIFEVLLKIDFIPDIMHLHDYHFALASVFLRDIKQKDAKSPFARTSAVFTIHNIAYQGIFGPDTLGLCGIDPAHFTMEGLEFYGNVNFMKAGIVYSAKITTVSPTYADEILTPEYGYRLEGVLASRRSDLSGIINGIDYSVWDPATDKALFANYSLQDTAPKQRCKSSLIESLFGKTDISQVQNKGIPVIGMVSRLSEQKGIDLIAGALEEFMKYDVYLVILGTGDEKYHRIMQQLQDKYKERFSLTLGYSDKLSREIYAGSDIFLMPSYYEPCGLGQLISLKYGTIPVVRNTGGLADTIIDIRTQGDIKKGGQGFKFYDYNVPAFLEALERSVKFYRDGKSWEKIVQNGMKCDFSWDYSAGKYLSLYKSAMEKK